MTRQRLNEVLSYAATCLALMSVMALAVAF